MTKSEKDWRELYPFESKFAQIGKHRMHYVDEGQGPVLMMVHGNPTWSFYWRDVIRSLSRNYRCIAVDNLGMGLSDKPQDYNYCLSNHIDNLVKLIEQLELSDLTMMVHDWGGPIGLGAANKVPERISRLVLSNTAAFPPPYVPQRIRLVHIPVFGSVAVRGLNLFCHAANRMTTHRPGGLTSQEKAGYLAPYDNWKNRVAVYKFVMDIPRTTKHQSYETAAWLEKAMPQFADRPALFVWGMQDWCFREECIDRLQVMLPKAEVVKIQEAGHYVNEDATDQVIEAFEQFLQKTDDA